MRRDAGRWPRALGTAVMGLLLAVLGTTAFSWWALGPLRLEPLIVLVVSVGYRLPLVLGFIVVMFLGYVDDLVSGGVMGINVVVFTVVYVICSTGPAQAGHRLLALSDAFGGGSHHLVPPAHRRGGYPHRALLRAAGEPAPAAFGPGTDQRPDRPLVFRAQRGPGGAVGACLWPAPERRVSP